MTDYTSKENYLSGAPEGYELICVEYFGDPLAVADREYLIGSSGALIRRTGNQMRMYRPIEKPWLGDGLPPVGTVCEARIPHHTASGVQMLWCEVETLAHAIAQGVEYSWVKEPGADGGFYAPMMLSFRPIKTPAQIAAEEREAAIEAMWNIYWQPSAPTAKEALGLLWGAGLRLPKAGAD